MSVLKYHYEGTDLEDKSVDSPHKSDILPLCRNDTQYGMIAQLRSWMPSDIGNVIWLAPYRPCTQVFIPWYYGITKIPDDFYIGDYQIALENHFTKYENIENETDSHNFWKYVNYANDIDNNYFELIPNVKSIKESTQQDIFNSFEEFEENLEKQYNRNQKRATKNIDFFMKDMIKISLDHLEQ